MTRPILSSTTLAIIALLAGCTPRPAPTAGFSDVQSLLQSRTPHRIAWNQNTPEDQAATNYINDLLAKPLTPDTATQIALLNNPTLQSHYESVGIAQADLVQAGLLPNPSVSLSAQFPTNGGLTKLDGNVATNLLSILFIPLRKKLATTELQRAQLQTAHNVLQIARDTQVAYYILACHQQQLALRQQAVDAADATLSLARRQHAAGTLTDLQLATDESLTTQSHLTLTQLMLTLQSDQESLNRLLGLQTPPTRWTLSPNPLPPPPDNLELGTRNSDLESLALSHRLDLLAARADVTLAQTALSLGRKGILTDLSPGVAFERDPEGVFTIGPSLSLDLPLFDQGQARIPRLQSLLRQSQRHLQSLELDIRSQVRLATAQLTTARETTLLYKNTILPQQRHLYDLTTLHFNAMQSNLHDLLTARTADLAAQESYFDALRDYHTARATLEQSLGTRLPTLPPTTQP
jgi:cobalt-zinc-cadmium efflux system outer membrane protein